MSATTDIRRWETSRDDHLADLFARGLNDEEVLDECSKLGYDLSPEGIQEKKLVLHRKTMELVARRGNQYLKEMLLASPSVRALQIERWIDQLNRSLQWQLDNNKHNVIPKVVEVGLKALSELRIEVSGSDGEVDERESQRARFESFSEDDRKAVIAAWEGAQSAWDEACAKQSSVEVEIETVEFTDD